MLVAYKDSGFLFHSQFRLYIGNLIIIQAFDVLAQSVVFHSCKHN